MNVKEQEWVWLVIFGLALVALGEWLPESEAGYEVLAPLATGSGVLLAAAASVRMVGLPTDEGEADPPSDA